MLPQTEQRTRFNYHVEQITLSATKQMPILAAKVGGCVSLGQGVPSFPTPKHIIDAMIQTLNDDPSVGKYSLQPGLQDLRVVISEYLKSEKALDYDPDNEVLVTVGAMGGLAEAFLAILNEGDEVILPEPTYASYIEQVHLAGGIPVFVSLRKADWSLDIKAVANAISSRTKAVVICNPSNPTGAVYDKATLIALSKIVKGRNIFLIIDETYDYLIYDDQRHFCPASLEGMKARSIVINSFSKKYALTGWRVGYVAAEVSIMAQIAKVHDATAICAPTPGQYAALTAITGPQDCVTEMNAVLHDRCRLACSRMDELSDLFDYVAPAGAFYLMARWKGRSMASHELALRLIKEAKVITIPGSCFGPGGEGHLRLSFGGSEKELNEAFDRLRNWAVGTI